MWEGKKAKRAQARSRQGRSARCNEAPERPASTSQRLDLDPQRPRLHASLLAVENALTLDSPLVKPGIPSFQTFSSPMGHFSFPLASVSGVKPGNNEHRQHLPHSNAIATGCAHQLLYGRAGASWP